MSPRRARNVHGELTEDAWQAQVTGLLDFYGWRWYHTHDSRRSPAGFPDIVAVRPPELLFIELKTDRGRPSSAQAEWIGALNEVAEAVEVLARHAIGEAAWRDGRRPELVALAVEAHLWRPRDFDLVHGRLARGRARHEPIGAT